MLRLASVCLALLWLALPLQASNRDTGSEPTTIESGKQTFLKQSAQIRRDLAKTDKYAELDKDNRAVVLATLDRMESLLEPVTGFEQLNDFQRVELFNEQGRVNALLTEAREDSRLVCTREKRLGSHRVTSHCETVAERRRRVAASSAELKRRLDTGQQMDNVARGIREGVR